MVVKSSIRVGNVASSTADSSSGGLSHEGASTSGVNITSTVNPSVSASTTTAANNSTPTHKHLLRSRVKLPTSEQSSSSKTIGKSNKKENSTTRYVL